jgi:hypothetical protein
MKFGVWWTYQFLCCFFLNRGHVILLLLLLSLLWMTLYHLGLMLFLTVQYLIKKMHVYFVLQREDIVILYWCYISHFSVMNYISCMWCLLLFLFVFAWVHFIFWWSFNGVWIWNGFFSHLVWLSCISLFTLSLFIYIYIYINWDPKQ